MFVAEPSCVIVVCKLVMHNIDGPNHQCVYKMEVLNSVGMLSKLAIVCSVVRVYLISLGIDIIRTDMHVYRGMQPRYKLEQKCLLTATFFRVNVIVINSLQHTVFFVDSHPNVGAIIGSKALLVFTQIDVDIISIFFVLIVFAPFIIRPAYFCNVVNQFLRFLVVLFASEV